MHVKKKIIYLVDDYAIKESTLIKTASLCAF